MRKQRKCDPEKILQGKITKRELYFYKLPFNKNEIIEDIHKIQHASLNNIGFYAMDSEIMSAISSPLINIIQHAGLLKLKLSSCKFDANDFAPIITSICNSSLQKLVLISVSIDEYRAKVIANTIQKSSLQSLSLNWCQFQDSALSIIIDSIVGSSMQHFELCSSHCHYTTEETMAISNCIENSSLIGLYLKGHHEEDKIATLIESIMQSSLKKLHINCFDFNCRINDIVMLITQTSITELELTCFEITREQLSVIIDAVKRNNHFEHISFVSMRICCENIDLICDLLENSKIKKIKLNSCGLHDADVIKLVNSIAKSELVVVCLQNNFIHNEGVRSLCSLLEGHNIEKINLADNKFDFCIIESLLPSIRKSALTKFDIGDSECSKLSINVKRELKSTLKEQQEITNRFHKVKSASMQL